MRSWAGGGQGKGGQGSICKGFWGGGFWGGGDTYEGLMGEEG